MPTVLRTGQYRIFFYSEEGTEPPHVHVEAGEKRAKLWMMPVELVWNDGFRTGEVKEIQQILRLQVNSILEAWYAFFLGK